MINSKPEIKSSVQQQSTPGLIQKSKKGIFPRLTLLKACELPKAILEAGQGEPVRRVKVFDVLGKSAESGPSRTLVSTSSHYGLTKGGYQAEYLHVTEVGKSFLQAPDESKTKLELAYKILEGNPIFVNFIEYWKDKQIPGSDIAEDWLVRNQSLSQSDAGICWNIIKQNISDWKLIEVLSGKNVLVSPKVVLEVSANGILEQVEEETPVRELEGDEEQNNELENASSQKNNQELSLTLKKTYGSAVAERDFEYGRAKLILPEKMNTTEKDQLKLLIDALVTEIK